MENQRLFHVHIIPINMSIVHHPGSHCFTRRVELFFQSTQLHEEKEDAIDSSDAKFQNSI